MRREWKRAMPLVLPTVLVALCGVNVGVHFERRHLVAGFAWLAVTILLAIPQVIRRARLEAEIRRGM